MSDAAPAQQKQPTGRFTHALRALRSRNYRLFFAGQTVSLVGNFMTQTAMAWMVYRLAREGAHPEQAPFLLGLVLFAGQVPLFLLTPFAGVWVDRWDRRRLLVATQALAMVQSLGLALLAYAGGSIGWVLALAFFQGLINAFDMPGRQAFVVDMVESRADLPNAIALNSTMLQTARLVGPAIGGFLIASYGEALCFLLDGLSYLAVIASLLAMTIHATGRGKVRDTVLREFGQGLGYVWTFVPIRVLILLTGLLCLFGMPTLQVMIPLYADQVLSTGGDGVGGHGARTLGLLGASLGAGAATGALLLAVRRSVLGLGRVICVAATMFGLAEIGFAFSPHLWLSMLILPLAGYGMISTFASVSTILQTLAEDEKRGRVMSFYTMAFGLMPFGSLLAGYAATRLGPGLLGPRRTLVISGILCVLTASAFALLLPSLRRIVRPVYVRKGILPEVAEGIREATEASPSPAA